MSGGLVRPEDVDAELAVHKEPYLLENWLDYLEHKKGFPEADILQIYRRALRRLPQSFKLWTGYLELVHKLAGKGDVEFLVKTYEQCLASLSEFPGLWQRFLVFLVENLDQLDISYVRRRFNEALQNLSVSQHFGVWKLFIRFADMVGGRTSFTVYRRYFDFRARLVDYDDLFADLPDLDTVIDKLVLYTDSADLFAKLGPVFETIAQNTSLLVQLSISEFSLYSIYFDLVLEFGDEKDAREMYRHLADKFVDQRCLLSIKLAACYEKKHRYLEAEDIFEKELKRVNNLHDFQLIFEAYTEMEDRRMTLLSQKLDDDTASELDVIMDRFEDLLARRKYLVSDTALRQNPDNIHEWLNRIDMYDSKNEIADCYAQAAETIRPQKVQLPGLLPKLWIHYAKFYAENGEVTTARKIFQTSTKVPFRHIEDLVDIWLAWAQWELEKDRERAVRVLEKALETPKYDGKINYRDEDLSPQMRIHKSTRLWQYYLDLIKSSKNLEATCKAYDRMIDVKVATAQSILDYAALLEDKKLYEESFRVYERGVLLFRYPTVYEIWVVYLDKILHYQHQLSIGVERIRDLFENALQNCPPELSKPIFLLYAQFEETRGSKLLALKVYRRAIEYIPANAEKVELYSLLAAKTIQFKNIESAREVYQSALESVTVNAPGFLDVLVQGFVGLELRLGQYRRCREIYRYAARLLVQFAKREQDVEHVWSLWKRFEVENGSEESYKELLRFKRHLENTVVNVRAKTTDSIGFVHKETRGALDDSTKGNSAEIALDIDEME
ncbi:hypothetical protein KL905_000754 [Ogataea polymorpha]|uniref:Pre-mRNA-splicing factor SYF1 n=1 Tax=Ogataea polymorpha TaxID=460523 RepID=A0A9P8TG24_9ASCO|nr:hypothetical protein KL937_001383 [Ogataea polymorpha]KAG7902006.1 hypothetical protein KL935_001966 [Ogataea polymorpha]KAG7911041.1 hypothetical protein KL906_001421 [Ogataea polymorpha]KAG7918413.1 hypothetical protein KL927_001870 [Ogataea polymorpha]KAG7923536.1 hypothetical protein KL905_000754 [Ogataea polymorpha]